MNSNNVNAFTHILVFPPLASTIEPSLITKDIGNIQLKIILDNNPLMIVIKPKGVPNKPVYILLIGIDIVFGKEHLSTRILPVLVGPLYDEYNLIRNNLRIGKPFYYKFITNKNIAYYVMGKHVKLMHNEIDECTRKLCEIVYNCSDYFIDNDKRKAHLYSLPNTDKPVEVKFRLIKSVSDNWFKIDLFLPREKIRKKIYMGKCSSKQDCCSMIAETVLYIYLVDLLKSKLALQQFQDTYSLLRKLYSSNKLLQVIERCINSDHVEACLVSAIYEAIQPPGYMLMALHSVILTLKELIKVNMNRIRQVINTYSCK